MKNIIDSFKNKKNVGNVFIMFGILLITTLEWHFYDMYQYFTRYGTLITFVCLAIAFLCYVDIKAALKDPVFYLMAATDIIALANLFLIGSNKGAILIVVDFMMILYLANKVVFTDMQIFITLAYVAFFFFYWTVDVKGYFKGYNTNYGGLILITGFALLNILLEYIRAKIKTDRKNLYPVFIVVMLFLFALAYNIISWYRSRTALVGLLVLTLFVILPKKIVANKIIYALTVIFSTVGAIMFAGFYMLLSVLNEHFSIQIFYKDVISGREAVWGELFTEFFKMPLTGIGSSYKLHVELMEGMLEVHSGLLDILIVHGIIVFIPVCLLLIKRMLALREVVLNDNVAKIAYAALLCILVTGFFENYFIVQPFSLILLFVFTIFNDRYIKEKHTL